MSRKASTTTSVAPRQESPARYHQFGLAKNDNGWPSDVNADKIFDIVDGAWDFKKWNDAKKGAQERKNRKRLQKIKDADELRPPMSIYPDGEDWREEFERQEKVRRDATSKRKIKLNLEPVRQLRIKVRSMQGDDHDHEEVEEGPERPEIFGLGPK